MTYQCLILDDEPIARNIVRDYIEQIQSLELAGECGNAFEAAEILKDQNIDIMFLDIQLPKISGLSFVKSLVRPPKIIVTSAHQEYALEGFNLSVSDYLLKPFSIQRFLKAVNKAIHELDLERGQTDTPKSKKEKSVAKEEILLLRSGNKLLKINIDSILYLEAYGNYVKVHTEDKTYLSNKTLQKLSEMLHDNGFIRIHRSFLVPFSKVEGIEGNQLLLAKKKLPVGQQFKQKLMNWLGNP